MFTDICHSLRISRSRSTCNVPNDQFSGTRRISPRVNEIRTIQAQMYRKGLQKLIVEIIYKN